jgi:hypothetical protein
MKPFDLTPQLWEAALTGFNRLVQSPCNMKYDLGLTEPDDE